MVERTYLGCWPRPPLTNAQRYDNWKRLFDLFGRNGSLAGAVVRPVSPPGIGSVSPPPGPVTGFFYPQRRRLPAKDLQ